MHHFFLTLVSSRHTVSAFFVSKFFICFAVRPSQRKTIFAPPLKCRSLQRGGNWWPSILNWWFGKLDSKKFYIRRNNNKVDSIETRRIVIHCVKSVQKRSFFWSVFSCIRTENGDLLRKFPYSVQTQENADQKKLRFWTLFTQWYKEKRKKYALDLLLPVNYCYFSRGAGAKSLAK